MQGRLATAGISLIAACVAAVLACYAPPSLDGPYRCQTDGTCGDPSLVCDDGICCEPFGFPVCPTLVLDGGVCANGGTPQVWFLDKDEDGHGDANSEKLACSRPVSAPETAPNAKWIEQGGDCNDSDPGIRPGAAEVCDDVDNDCDGEVDELFVKQTFYADKDKDGFGQKDSQGFVLCAPQGDYTSTDPRDCDDANAQVNPDATELCNGVDDDCDGTADDAPTDVGTACPSGLQGACAPGTLVCSNGAPVCAPNIKPMELAETCNGVDDDCDGDTDEALTTTCFLAPGRFTRRATDSGVRYGGDTNAPCLGLTGTQTVFNSPVWYGNPSNTQVFYAAVPSGSLNVTELARDTVDISFEARLTDPNGKWSAFKQPVLYLCAADGTYARYVHVTGDDWGGFGQVVLVNESFVVNLPQWGSSNGWSQTRPSPPLTRIVRAEIHLETSMLSPSPFEVTWKRFQLR